MTTCDLVVNCTKSIEFYATNAVQIRLPVKDDGTQRQDDKLYDLIKDDRLFRKIYRQLSSNKTVLIHCHAGQQRSPATLACFLMFMWSHHASQLKFNTAKDVVNFIKQKREQAFLNGVHFMSTIERYWKKAKRRRNNSDHRLYQGRTTGHKLTDRRIRGLHLLA